MGDRREVTDQFIERVIGRYVLNSVHHSNTVALLDGMLRLGVKNTTEVATHTNLNLCVCVDCDHIA